MRVLYTDFMSQSLITLDRRVHTYGQTDRQASIDSAYRPEQEYRYFMGSFCLLHTFP